MSFDNIFFKFDSTELRDDASRLQVEEIATTLKSPKLAGTRFLIEGHTCDLGEDALGGFGQDYLVDIAIGAALSEQIIIANNKHIRVFPEVNE